MASNQTGKYVATKMGFFRGARVRTGQDFTVTEDDLDDNGNFEASWAVPVDADGNAIPKTKGGRAKSKPADAIEPGASLLDKSPQEIKAALSTMTQSEKAELNALDEAEGKGKNRKAIKALIADALAREPIPNLPGAAPGELTPSHPTVPAGGASTPPADDPALA